MKYLSWVTQNFWWKVFSILVSLSLWLLLVGHFDVGASVPVTVQFRNLPNDLEISSDMNDKFYLKVRGPAGRLSQESLSGSMVVLDLSSVSRSGEQTFPLTEDNVVLPPAVRLERIVPSQIRLRFEQRVTREVPIEVRFAGAPPEGYRLVSRSVNPERVKITGPKSHVDPIHSVDTDPLDISGTYGSAEFRTAIFIPDAHVRCEDCGPVSVRIQLEKVPGKPAITQ